jgi:nucleotide-binding universal stress UspA family protein
MVPYKHIAVCVEHESEMSQRSLEAARRLRALGEGRLTLLHALANPVVYPALPGSGVQTWIPDPAEHREAAQTWLEKLALPGEEAVVLSGYAPEAACGWAHGANVDLIVAAAHRGLVDRMLLGSFAGYLVRHAPCPVLLIRPTADAAIDAAHKAA